MRGRIRIILKESMITDDQRAEFVYQVFKKSGIELPYEIGNLHISTEDVIHAWIWEDEKYLMDSYGEALLVSEVVEPVKRITEIYINGGVLQRIVYLNDISELNTNYLGKYWIGDPYEFFNGGGEGMIADMSRKKGNRAYIIEAEIPPYAVDCFNSFRVNTMNIEEAEITILDEYVPRIKYLGYEKYK